MTDSRLHDKLPDVGTTIFTVMSQLAASENAINLSQGFPDFDCPEALKDRLNHYVATGHNQYAPMPGLPVLRDAIAVKTERCYGVRPNPDSEITVTAGATEALFAAFQALVGAGDEVIVFDPAYDSYDPAIRLAGGRAVHVPLTPGAFALDHEALADAITDRTRVIVLNSPQNPACSAVSRDDLLKLAEFAERHDLWFISDEVYEHIIFDGAAHQSMLRMPELARRAIVISSFGKTFHATGWKLGYAVATPELTTLFRKKHQYINFCCFTPAQLAYADFLESDPNHYLDLPAFYQKKRDAFVEQLTNTRFTFTPSAGTYFQLVDYSAISDEPDTEFANRLTREFKVAAIPISVFYQSPPPDQHIVRLCFAKDESTLIEAGGRLARV